MKSFIQYIDEATITHKKPTYYRDTVSKSYANKMNAKYTNTINVIKEQKISVLTYKHREYIVTLDESLIKKYGGTPSNKYTYTVDDTKQKANPDTITVFDIRLQEWRSFTIDEIESVYEIDLDAKSIDNPEVTNKEFYGIKRSYTTKELPYTQTQLKNMVDGFLTAAIFSLPDINSNSDKPMNTKYNIENVTTKSRDEVTKECEDFLQKCKEKDIVFDSKKRDLYSVIGQDFLYTRNGEGSSFSDNDKTYYSGQATTLKTIAQTFHTVHCQSRGKSFNIVIG